MAKQTFKNPREGAVTFNFENGSPPAFRVAAGASVTSGDEHVKRALKDAGFERSSEKKQEEK